MPPTQWGARPLALRVYQAIARVLAPLWREIEHRRAGGDALRWPAVPAAWGGPQRDATWTSTKTSADEGLLGPIWVHAASVGACRPRWAGAGLSLRRLFAGEGVLAACVATRPIHRSWILSVGTRTGRDAVRRRFPDLEEVRAGLASRGAAVARIGTTGCCTDPELRRAECGAPTGRCASRCLVLPRRLPAAVCAPTSTAHARAARANHRRPIHLTLPAPLSSWSPSCGPR